MKGYISNEYTVTCGICSDWYMEAYAKNINHSKKLFKFQGWIQHKQYGWLCPECKLKRLSYNQKDIIKGAITTQFTIWCGNCGEWDQISDSLKGAKQDFALLGWKNTHKHGWLCLECYRDRKNIKT